MLLVSCSLFSYLCSSGSGHVFACSEANVLGGRASFFIQGVWLKNTTETVASMLLVAHHTGAPCTLENHHRLSETIVDFIGPALKDAVGNGVPSHPDLERSCSRANKFLFEFNCDKNRTCDLNVLHMCCTLCANVMCCRNDSGLCNNYTRQLNWNFIGPALARVAACDSSQKSVVRAEKSLGCPMRTRTEVIQTPPVVWLVDVCKHACKGDTYCSDSPCKPTCCTGHIIWCSMRFGKRSGQGGHQPCSLHRDGALCQQWH